MLDWIKKNLIRFRELIMYGIVGVATTLLNIGAFWLFDKKMGLPGIDFFGAFTIPGMMVSNALAWFISVVFAFFANKLFVFENHGWSAKVVWKEALDFFISRAASLLADEFMLWLLADVFAMDSLVAKVISNVVVIIINYLLGKFWVFHKKQTDEEPAPKKSSEI